MFLAGSLVTAACDEGEIIDPIDDPYYVPSYKIAGTVVNWENGNPVGGTATVVPQGVTPPPTVQIDGASFIVDGIPPSSVLHLLSGYPPNYRNTYSQAIEVVNADLGDVQAKVLSEAYITTLLEAFNVTPAPGTGIILAKIVDGAGVALAGVPKEAFYLNGATPPKGPYFLDTYKQPDRDLTATGPSGYAVFFDVPPGPVTINAAPNANYYVSAPVATVGANAVTLADIYAAQGAPPPPPLNPSFVDEIVPIFTNRGCVYCHSGGGAGRQDGGLSLKVGPNQIHTELTVELSPGYQIPRVNLAYPEQSLILTLPGFVVDNHPNTTFASADDPDYVLILAWITAGAQLN